MKINNIIAALVAVVLVFGSSLKSYSQEAAVDSVAIKADIEEYRFRPTQLIAPGVLIAVGGFGVSNGWFKGIKEDVRDGMDHMRGHCYFHADDWLQYAPVVAYVGMGAIGAKSKHGIVERLCAGATAYAAMGILTNGIKYTVREKRPDSNARNSFPSGHTATAFMGAELVRLEYGWPYAVGAYTVATGIAFLRLYNGRHWLNDVIAGAGIGIISAEIGYWMLPLYQKWFKLGPYRRATVTSALPFYSPYDRAAGLAFAMQF